MTNEAIRITTDIKKLVHLFNKKELVCLVVAHINTPNSHTTERY